MRYPILTILALIFAISTTTFAQTSQASKAYLADQFKVQKILNPVKTSTFFPQQASKMGLSAADEMRKVNSSEDKLGMEHIRYHQFYKNIPVVGSNYVLHTKDDQVISATGYYSPLIDMEIKASISPGQAVQIAMEKMNAKVYSWEGDAHLFPGHSHDRPEAKLKIIGKKFPKPSEHYLLVYEIDLYSSEPMDGQQYFIDAQTGHVALEIPLLKHTTVPATGETKYYGTQTIYVDSISPNEYLLQDLERGNGVVTVDQDQVVWKNDSKDWNFVNADQDEVAIDAHYSATAFYDYLLSAFNWNGLGNNGEELRTVVHGGNFVNAFWNGEFASFGDGNCNNGPLTTLEVVGHEFAHGLTDYTSDLIYSDESGAINESMSDVFGKALEYYTTPADFNWFIGQSFNLTDYAEPFRDMANPNDFNLPKFYKGEFWTDGGGVHTNSSIGNHWFHILVEGKTGVNELGEAFNVQAIGMDKAMQIVFRTQSIYLGPSSTYSDYYQFSVMAVDDIHGAGSSESNAVREAWKAVGLPYVNASQSVDLALSLGDLFVFTCEENVFYNAEVTISNVGSEAYQPSMNGEIIINGTTVRTLDNSIQPGTSLVFNVDDYLFIDFEGTEGLNTNVQLDGDENYANNDDYQVVENSFYPDNDISLLFYGFPNRKCTDGPQDFRFTISNRSCSFVPAGSKFTLRIESAISSFSYTEEITIEDAIAPDRNRTFTRALDIPFDQEINLEAIIDYESDPNILNNAQLVIGDEPFIITEDFFTGINDENFDQLPVNGFESDVVEWNGDTYFASTGYSTDPFTDLCPTPVGIIEGNFASSDIEVCINFEDSDESEVKFDLVQFRSPDAIIDFPELYPLSTIARLRWETDSDRDETFYYDQTEGEVVGNSLILPEGFKGKLRFDFSSHTGDLGGDDYLDYDVNLFDNLNIVKGPVSTKTPNQSDLVKISPNPSSNQFFIEHSEAPVRLILNSSQGSLLKEYIIEGNNQILDLTNYTNGIYILRSIFSDGSISTQKLIKLN